MHAAPMTLNDRLCALKSRHRELDKRIRDELTQPTTDGLRTQTLERMRLRTKDKLALITRQLASQTGTGRPEAA